MQKPTKKLWRKIGLQKNYLEGTSHSDQYKNTLSREELSNIHTESEHSHRISELDKNFLKECLSGVEENNNQPTQTHLLTNHLTKQSHSDRYSLQSPIDHLNFQSFDQRYNQWNKQIQQQQQNNKKQASSTHIQTNIQLNNYNANPFYYENFNLLKKNSNQQQQQSHVKNSPTIQPQSISSSLQTLQLATNTNHNNNDSLSIQTQLMKNKQIKRTYPINSPNNKQMKIHIFSMEKDNQKMFTKSLPPTRPGMKEERIRQEGRENMNRLMFQEQQEEDNTVEIVECEQILTIQPKQLQHLKSVQSKYHHIKQQLYPTITKTLKNHRQQFNLIKSHINLQLTLFYNFINKQISSHLQQQIQQYTDQIGYLYKQNQQLLQKIQDKQTSNKKYWQQMKYLQQKIVMLESNVAGNQFAEEKLSLETLIQTQQNEINKLYEKMEDYEEIQNKNQVLGKQNKQMHAQVISLKSINETIKKQLQLSNTTLQLARSQHLQTLNKFTHENHSLMINKQQKIKQLQSEINIMCIKFEEKQYKARKEFQEEIKRQEGVFLYNLQKQKEDMKKQIKKVREEEWKLVAKQYEEVMEEMLEKINGLEVQNIVKKFNIQKNQYMGKIFEKYNNSNVKILNSLIVKPTLPADQHVNNHYNPNSKNYVPQIQQPRHSSPKSDSNSNSLNKNLRRTGFFGQVGNPTNLNIRLDDIQGKYSNQIQQQQYQKKSYPSNNRNNYPIKNKQKLQQEQEPSYISSQKLLQKCDTSKFGCQLNENKSDANYTSNNEPYTNKISTAATSNKQYLSTSSNYHNPPTHNRIKTQSNAYQYDQQDNSSQSSYNVPKNTNYNYRIQLGNANNQNTAEDYYNHKNNNNIGQNYSYNESQQLRKGIKTRNLDSQTLSAYGNHNYSFSEMNNFDNNSSGNLDDNNSDHDRRSSMIYQRAETYRQPTSSSRGKHTSREKYHEYTSRVGNNFHTGNNTSTSFQYNPLGKNINDHTNNSINGHTYTPISTNQQSKHLNSDRSDIVEKIKQRLKQKFNKSTKQEPSYTGRSNNNNAGINRYDDENKKLFRQSEYNHRRPIKEEFGEDAFRERNSIDRGVTGGSTNVMNLSHQNIVNSVVGGNRRNNIPYENHSRSPSNTPNKRSRSPSNSSNISHHHLPTAKYPSHTLNNTAIQQNRPTISSSTNNYTKINKPTGNIISTSFSKSAIQRPQFVANSRLANNPTLLGGYQQKSSLYTATKGENGLAKGSSSSYIKKY